MVWEEEKTYPIEVFVSPLYIYKPVLRSPLINFSPMLACLPFDIIAETSVKFLATGFLKIELKVHSYGYAGFFISLFVSVFRYSGGLCLYLVPQNNNDLVYERVTSPKHLPIGSYSLVIIHVNHLQRQRQLKNETHSKRYLIITLKMY